jgi:hypothetical protein
MHCAIAVRILTDAELLCTFAKHNEPVAEIAAKY